MKKFIAAAILAASALSASAAAATQAYVGNVHLNARSGPGTNYHVIGTFNPCTPVHVVAHKWGWAKVAYKHNYYWVSAQYLSGHSCHYAPKPTYKKKHYKKHYNNGYGY